jgi:tRNA threonylcarbamoyladenosine biosynthesis protein TsaE
MGRVLVAGDVLLLTGDLGAGKTTFVRGLARGLGVAFGVKSPTFAIHLRYPGRLPLDHLDLYRLGDPRDLAELGLEDVLGRDGVSVVEWGERLGDLAPASCLSIQFEECGPTQRRLVLRGTAADLQRMAASGPWEPE